MKTRGFSAFTLLEVLLVLVMIAIVAALLLPAIARRKARSSRINCVNNLKQVGLAFRTWAIDSNDKFPMQVSVTNGGTMELVSAGKAFVHFRVLSNELSTPKVLFCPEENNPGRTMAIAFSGNVPPGIPNQVPFASDTNTTYFVGEDAEDANPNIFLSGDCNLLINGTATKPGLHSVWTNSLVGWVKPRHNGGGNIGLSDGSVQQVSGSGLKLLLQRTGLATNRLAIP